MTRLQPFRDSAETTFTTSGADMQTEMHLWQHFPDQFQIWKSDPDIRLFISEAGRLHPEDRNRR